MSKAKGGRTQLRTRYLYKLADAEGYTRRGNKNALKWGNNTTHKAKEKGRELCTPQVIHAYESPLLAVLLNPIHAGLNNPQLWLARGRVVAREHQIKVGCKTLTTTKRLQLPEITTAQRVEFAIRVSLLVYKDPGYAAWAAKWLSGEDRSAAAAADAADAAYADYADYAAYAAADAADAAAKAAADAAAKAAYAAKAAADAAAKAAAYAAANAAAKAADADYADYADYAAADAAADAAAKAAADAAAKAAYAAAYAAYAAADAADAAKKPLDLIAIAEKVCE